MIKFQNVILLTGLLASTSTQLFADAPRAYLEFESSKGAALVVDGQEYEPAFWSGWAAAQDAFASDPAAKQHFDTYVSDLRTGQLVLWGGLLADIGFLFYAANNTEQFSEGTVDTIYWGTLLGALVVSGHYQASATEHFHKAINTYNGVYRAKKAETESSQKFEFVPGVWASEYKGSQQLAPSFGLKFSF